MKFLPRTADDYATVSAAAVLTLDKSKKTISRRADRPGQRRNHPDPRHRR